MNKDEMIAMLKESRANMHRMIDEHYDKLCSCIENGERITAFPSKPRSLHLTAPPSVFRGEKPATVMFADGTTVSTPTWKSVAAAVLNNCNSDPQMHERLMQIRGSIAGRYRIILGDDPFQMQVPVKIDDDLYFEGKFDTEYLMRMMTEKIFNRIGYDYSGIVVTLRAEQATDAFEPEEPEVDSDREQSEGFGMQIM